MYVHDTTSLPFCLPASFLPSFRIENSTSIPTTLYEFPNGYNINLTIEKYKLCEGLFDSSTLKGVSGGTLLSIPHVAINSAAMCDVDIRPVCGFEVVLWMGIRNRVKVFS